MAKPLLGAIEAGGTKINLAVGCGPKDVRATLRLPTLTPGETLPQIARFFEEQQAKLGPVAAFGVASFGPIRLDPAAPDYGQLLATPKTEWAGASFLAPLRAFGAPIAVDTDVNAAALAEHRYGAGRDAGVLAYLTVGTGIGLGLIVNGSAVHGLLHPEFGHIRLARARGDNDFAGLCPYHGDCLEGLACGPAIRARWGEPLSELGAGPRAQIADYLGQACAALVLTLSVERIVIGGGVGKTHSLLSQVQTRMGHWLGGYLDHPTLRRPGFICSPAFEDRAGVAGAFELARDRLGGLAENGR